jgi:predicted transposase YbfD/YdcC
LSGAESYDSIELFGQTNIDFLRQFLSLPNGIPSHDTINRVFQAINSRSFERLFTQWTQGIKDEGLLEKVIAIDGKTSRGSKDSFHAKSAIHTVHAWSVEHGVCLGQRKCAGKSNEIKAIPELLDVLQVKGVIITIDAMGTQTDIAAKIVEKEGDYIMAVKGNQGFLQEEVLAQVKRAAPVKDSSTCEKGHGRIETRRCQVFDKGVFVV